MRPTEKDLNGDVLWTWIYPEMGAKLREVISRKTGLGQEEISGALNVFGHFQTTWYYLHTTPATVLQPANLPEVRHLSLFPWHNTTKKCNLHLATLLSGLLSRGVGRCNHVCASHEGA